ncbi:hypothetical protein AX14_003264 [Amanita brunnescens Koide BX004]|nr:hypothetical protein AX14_003264 [Amanita brunnescens Koide BX004]
MVSLLGACRTEISGRPMQELVYIVANLGFSLNFGAIDYECVRAFIDTMRKYGQPWPENKLQDTCSSQ